MNAYPTPGVYFEKWQDEPRRALLTGVPGFLGFVTKPLLSVEVVEEDDIRELDKCPKVSERFRRQFSPLNLSSDSQVQVSKPTEQWTIVDGNQRYSAVRRGQAIDLYAIEVGRAESTSGVIEWQGNALGRVPSLRQTDHRAATPNRFSRWSQFEETLARDPRLADGFTRYAVKGFFANGGRLCYVQLIDYERDFPSSAEITAGLEAFLTIEDVDLICVPDLMSPVFKKNQIFDAGTVIAVQNEVLRFCDDHGRYFAILDSLPGADTAGVKEQRGSLQSDNGALYYPWIKMSYGPEAAPGFVPPCGQVAAIYTRSDERVGIHKAPANEALVDVVDLERTIDNKIQDQLNPNGVNCLRAFPGRGIRVWGARTLSTSESWTYVNVRRIFLTAARWIDRNMAGYVFEPHTPELWARITRDLTTYFTDLWTNGALVGNTPDEAFFVKCNAENNPDEDRDLGRIVAEIGLAPAIPGEFIVVRIIQLASGINMVAPGQLGP